MSAKPAFADPPARRPSYVIEDQNGLTEIVVEAMSGAESIRFQQVAAAFVRHMHAFAREVQLTEDELHLGIDFLNRIGQASHDAHNEGVLFSDAIGLSTLVCLINNGQGGATETAAALLGPFWRMNSPRAESGGSIVRSPTPGAALFASCRVTDPKGTPIAGVEIDVWQASPIGLYENQDEAQADMNLRGKFVTDADGRFAFRSVKPAGYPVPTHGPVGEMLRVQRRHEYRPAHLHFLGFKQGYKTLITQVFVDDDANLQSDVVFGVTRALIGDYRKGQGTPPAADVEGDWYRLDYTFVMQPGEAKLPAPPIK